MSESVSAPIDTLKDMLTKAEPHFLQILDILKPSVINGKYDSILGDDVSGRIPALAVGHVICRYAFDNDKKSPSRFFFAGGSQGEFPDSIKKAVAELGDDFTSDKAENVQNEIDQLRNQNLMAYFGWIKPKLGKRSLVVTELLTTGRTMYETSIALHNVGVSFDIATLGAATKISAYGEYYSRVIPQFSSSIMTGGSTSASLLYASPRHLGNPLLRKIIGIEKDWIAPITLRMKKEETDTAGKVRAREIIREYADSLYEQTFLATGGVSQNS